MDPLQAYAQNALFQCQTPATISDVQMMLYQVLQSMEPEFHNGDKVLVQRYPNCPAMEPGDVGAFITGNETYIKEYQRDGLHSYNKKYKTMKFTDEEDVYLIGKVIKKLSPRDIVSFEDAMRYQRVMTRKKK